MNKSTCEWGKYKNHKFVTIFTFVWKYAQNERLVKYFTSMRFLKNNNNWHFSVGLWTCENNKKRNEEKVLSWTLGYQMKSRDKEKVGSPCYSFTPTFLFIPSNLHEENSAFSFLNVYTSFFINKFLFKKDAFLRVCFRLDVAL